MRTAVLRQGLTGLTRKPGTGRLPGAAVLAVWLLAMPSAPGDVTCTLHLDGVPSEIANQITMSIQEAVAVYDEHGSFNKHLDVYYDSGVPTAQANYNGTIEFGGSRNTRVALHEMGHTMGIGQHGEYWNHMVNGVWEGYYGRALAIEMGSPYADGIHGGLHRPR